MRELSKEESFCEDDRRSIRGSRGRLMLTGGWKLDAPIVTKSPRVDLPENSGKNVEATAGAVDQPGGGQYLIAPCGVRFGSGHSDDHKEWCPYRMQGQTAARSGDQGSAALQEGSPVFERPSGRQ